MELALDDIVDIFSRKHSRRMTLPDILSDAYKHLFVYVYFIDFFIDFFIHVMIRGGVTS